MKCRETETCSKSYKQLKIPGLEYLRTVFSDSSSSLSRTGMRHVSMASPKGRNSLIQFWQLVLPPRYSHKGEPCAHSALPCTRQSSSGNRQHNLLPLCLFFWAFTGFILNSIYLFMSFYIHTYGIQKFLGPGSNPSCICNLSTCAVACGNVRSLVIQARDGTCILTETT